MIRWSDRGRAYGRQRHDPVGEKKFHRGQARKIRVVMETIAHIDPGRIDAGKVQQELAFTAKVLIMVPRGAVGLFVKVYHQRNGAGPGHEEKNQQGTGPATV